MRNKSNTVVESYGLVLFFVCIKVAATEMRHRARGEFLRSLVHNKKFGLIGYLF